MRVKERREGGRKKKRNEGGRREGGREEERGKDIRRKGGLERGLSG